LKLFSSVQFNIHWYSASTNVSNACAIPQYLYSAKLKSIRSQVSVYNQAPQQYTCSRRDIGCCKPMWKKRKR